MYSKIIRNIPFETKICLAMLATFLITFSIYRLVFLYFFISDFNISFLGSYLLSFYFGLKMDIIISVMLCIPFLILLHIPIVKFNGIIKSLFKYYILIILIIIGFLNVINIEFFQEFSSHLNMQAQMYGFESGFEAWIQVWIAYPILTYFLIIFFGAYVPYKILKKILNLIEDNKNLILSKYFYYLPLLIFSLVIIYTGIFKMSRVIDSAYFTNKNDMANNLAINCVYHYIYSLVQNNKEPNINFYKDSYIVTERIINENRQNINDNKFIKYDKPPNIIMIILESYVGSRCNFINENLKENITPNLDKLASESINFENCYANGPRTAHGLSSILCSWPTIPGYPLIRQSKYQKKGKITFASIFKNLGYETGFIYGGNSEFDEMKKFVKSNSFDKIYDHNTDNYLSQFKLDNKHGGNNPWGVFDEFIFNKTLDIMNSRDNESPIMLTILTTTNHAPWVVPEHFQSQISDLNINQQEPFSMSKATMKYVDSALGNFFKNAKRNNDWFDNTIFIITADHGLNISKDKINDPINGHIPLLIYNTGLSEKVNKKFISHVDILPTILDLIGQYDKFDQTLFGCSGFRGKNGFVFRNNDYNIQLIKDNFVYSEILNTNFNDYYYLNKIQKIRKTQHDSLQKICRSYNQVAFNRNK